MADRTVPQGVERDAGEAEHPRGTLALLLVYLIVIVGLWLAVYFTLLQRGM